MDLKLKGKRAFIMGGSSGIGRAIAQAFINEGATVAICSRDQQKLEIAAKEIGAHHHFTCDLSKPGESKAATEKALQALGGLDILVTNTGGPKRGSFAEISTEQWHTDFQSLWMSVIEALNVALPAMQKNKFGRILCVTSFAAKEPRAGLTTSNGFRAGLAGLIKSVANEYAAHGITLNLLLPGFTNTDRIKDLKLTDEKIREMVPAGRLCEPHELANLAVFLGSALSGYTTGQSIVVDGGVLRSH